MSKKYFFSISIAQLLLSDEELILMLFVLQPFIQADQHQISILSSRHLVEKKFK